VVSRCEAWISTTISYHKENLPEDPNCEEETLREGAWKHHWVSKEAKAEVISTFWDILCPTANKNELSTILFG
jgi:hypothetical protein